MLRSYKGASPRLPFRTPPGQSSLPLGKHEMETQNKPRRQARYWICTRPYCEHVGRPSIKPGVEYIKGQLEEGEETGYLHWQFIIYCKTKVSRPKIKEWFGADCHCEPTRSAAAEDYVWKDRTAVDGTRWSEGQIPFNRTRKRDWELEVWEKATRGELLSIDADIRVRCYKTLRQIELDYLEPTEHQVTTYVYWGKTGLGKSRRAKIEAGKDYYPKGPTNIWWNGYRGQSNVIIDEFRGRIGCEHLLTWCNPWRLKTIIEPKGTGRALEATSIWITSNLDPREWYPDLDEDTKEALLRRFKIVHFLNEWKPPDNIGEEPEQLLLE